LFSFTTTPTSCPYTLSLHDALPICPPGVLTATKCPHLAVLAQHEGVLALLTVDVGSRTDSGQRIELIPLVVIHPIDAPGGVRGVDRKSTRLNSSHRTISYAVFCLKK